MDLNAYKGYVCKTFEEAVHTNKVVNSISCIV